jgi:glycosyltransferase involved in cell wall biosynthesis
MVKYDTLDINLVYNVAKGVSKARNIGIEFSLMSKYVVFIDDDDFVSDTFIISLLHTVIEGKADVAQSNFKNVIGGRISDDYISKGYQNQVNKKYSLLNYRKFFSSVCGKIFNVNAIGDIRFREDIHMAEDAVFMFAISKNVKRFYLTNDDCIYFRNVREGSALRTPRGLFQICKDYYLNLSAFTGVYLSEPFKYNFLFYISRILAITKYLKTEILFYVRSNYVL